MDICTIIAKNYAPFARVLARSFRAHHPEGRCFTLVIDDFEGYIDPADEPFEVVTPVQLNIEDFDRMAALYSVLELSTAVKPWLLRHLLGERGCRTISYLDPDIEVFASLETIDDLLQDHTVVVTPHLTEPMPRDGRKPSETDILIAGAYNLGFVGLRGGPDTDYLLDWWSERLRRDCIVAPELGYFVDQRWMDFAPGLVTSFYILREPEYNVAYWNLATRQVTRRGDAFFVNARPLRFFHFSGFDPEVPTSLSKHQDRIQLRENRALAELCRRYAAKLFDADYKEAKDWPYSYSELAGGIPLDGPVRDLFRETEAAGALQRSVFDCEGAREFVEWMNAPATVGAQAGVTRYLERLHERRPDLRMAFPDLEGAGGHGLVTWAQTIGRDEVPIPPQLVPSPNGASVRSGVERSRWHGERKRPDGREDDQPTRRRPVGVNVAGYLGSVVGVGEIARQVVTALETQGVEVATVLLPASLSQRLDEAPPERRAAEPRHPVNLICVNADMLPAFVQDMGAAFFEGRRSIGYWWWEVSQFPERWLGSFDYLDEIWVGSEHVAGALAPVSPVPVGKLPVPVSMPPVQPMERSDLGLPSGFLFLFAFDYNSVFERKNPLAAIEAFKAAFAPGSGAALVIKSINHERDRQNHERLLAAAGSHPDVHVIDRYVTRAEKDAMLAACDCYVSLHRSEGFGITLAEAMYVGKPVIATAYSGNLEYMRAENSFRVDYRLIPIGPGAGPYPPEGEWAEPDLAHAARLMREVFDDPAGAHERGSRAAADIRRDHSPEAAGQAMVERLKAAPAPRAGRSTGAAGMPAVADTTRVSERIHTGPPPPAPARLAAVRHRLRQVVLRLMKPWTVHQRLVDLELLRAIEHLDRGVRNLAATHAAERAAIDRELGRLVGEMDRLVSESRATPYMAKPLFRLQKHPLAGVVSGYAGGASRTEPAVGRYREFEELFRGSESFIRARQRGYLDVIGERSPVFEAGCGRGEFLDLLRERGVEYTGVDTDPGMVEHCRGKGHERVQQIDANSALNRLADGSLGAVFSAQVIEHMPYDALLRFFALSQKKLQPGGVLVAETVNPHSVPALKTFWVDLTHQHPIFPEVALALARISGFESAFVFHPNGERDFETDRFREGEYAVVATKD